MAYKRIGDMLVAGGYLTEEKLKAGLAESRRTGKKLGETLVEMGFIRQSDLINVLENQLDVEYVDLQQMSLPKNLVSVIPRAIAKKYNVVPLASDANTVTIAIADYGDLKPGMNVTAAIRCETAENAVSVPVAAVSRGNVVLVPGEGALAEDGTVADPAKLEERQVVLGVSDGDYIEITSGLSAGDTVVYQAAETGMGG